MSIRLVKVAPGHRVPLLVDGPGGLPDPYVAAYATWRLNKVDLNTLRNQLAGISKSLAFLAGRDVDLVARCRSGRLLTDGELEQLAGRLKGEGSRDLTTAGPHFGAFANYVLWLARQFSPVADAGDDPRRVAQRERFAKTVKDCKPPKADAGNGPVLGLSKEERALFLSVIIPEHPRHPFQTMGFRNFVFMSTSFLLGLRTGELLGLKLEDVELDRAEPLLKVVVRPRDPDDPRTWPADQKTYERTLPLSPELAYAFQILKRDRKKIAAAKRHKYVFVNRRGGPLGHRGARGQYQLLREAVPELEGLINHRLRHDWNDRWLETAEEKGWKLEEMLRHQIYLMGWKIGSKMPGRYGENERQKQAKARLVEVQKKALGRRRPT